MSTSAVWAQARPDVPATSPSLDRILPLEVTVNGDKSGTWPFVERQGMLYVSREALDDWRIQLRPGAQAITVRGVDYWPLAAVPGYAVKTNYANQSVDITFAAEAFTVTKLNTTAPERYKASPVLPSAFANYELTYSGAHDSVAGNTSSVGALLEVGGSNDWGVLTSSFAGRNLTRSTTDPSGWLRLETTFTRHLPDQHYTLRVGDSGTRVGLWGRGAYFGGVQFGTNYSLTPGFLTQPVPIVGGVSSAPSTVELYVNGVLRQVSQVPAGPFAIDNTAALSGSGEARIVVRDILGREIVLTQPFFTSASLLAKGLADWGAEAGSLRRDLGQASSHYGPQFGSGTWRYGVTDLFTVEGRGEATRAMQSAGAGVIAGLPGEILGKAALATSRDDSAGRGRHWMAGAEKHWVTTSLYFQYEGSSRSFRSLGLSDTVLPMRRQAVINATHTTASIGSLGFAIASLQPWGNPTTTSVSASYSMQLRGNSTLSANISKALGASGGTSVGISLQIPLEGNRQFTATAQSHGGRTDIYATASQTAGLDTQLGWRVLGGQLSGQAHAEGGLYYQGRDGTLYGDVSSTKTNTAVRAGASGGLVVADSRLFVTRRVEQSYALVEVKDQADVGVGLGTNMIAVTDPKGIALVPNLGPYVANQIRLNPQDLPLTADVESIEQIVVPAWRSGVKVNFPVRAGRAALVKINLEDGQPAPPGAVLRIENDKQEFWVARRGEAYVTGLQPGSRVELTWDGQHCPIEIVLPPAGKDDIARVGPVVCKGVKR
jgi:outer membrane usher protein